MNAECMGKLWADKCRLQKRYFSFPFVATRSWQGGKKIRSHLRKGKRKISVKKWKVIFVVIMGPIKWAGGKDVKHNKTFYSPRSPVTVQCPSYHWLGWGQQSSHEKPEKKENFRNTLKETLVRYAFVKISKIPVTCSSAFASSTRPARWLCFRIASKSMWYLPPNNVKVFKR